MMVLMVLFFAPLFITLGLCTALCFKIASLYRRISNLNRLVSDMIKRGVSEEALVLACDYYNREEVA